MNVPSRKSLSDLGMYFPCAVRQIHHKIPPKSWLNLWPKQGRLWTKKNKECCFFVQRLKLQPTAIAYQQYTLWGCRMKNRIRHSLHWINTPLVKYISQEKFQGPRILASSCTEKSTEIISGDICSSWLAAPFLWPASSMTKGCKWVAWAGSPDSSHPCCCIIAPPPSSHP